MDDDIAVGQVSRRRYPQHAASLDRHATWACEFAAVGDFAAALDALLDFHAVVSELLNYSHPRASKPSEQERFNG